MPSKRELQKAAGGNRLFAALMVAFAIGFLTQLAGGVYFVIHTNDAAREICKSANENRGVVLAILKQQQTRSDKGQFIPVEVRDPAAPKTPTKEVLLFVPPTPEARKQNEEARKVAALIDCTNASL